MSAERGEGAARGPTVHRVELGYVSGVLGVHGWIKVHSFTRPRESILGYGVWHLGVAGTREEYVLEDGRMHGGGVVAKLGTIDDRNHAENLIGARIEIPAAALEEPAADEYYWRDLIGLSVRNIRGDTLGRVRELMETGANDVLVVDGDERLLVPFTRNAVVEVDLERGEIVVDWEKGF